MYFDWIGLDVDGMERDRAETRKDDGRERDRWTTDRGQDEWREARRDSHGSMEASHVVFGLVFGNRWSVEHLWRNRCQTVALHKQTRFRFQSLSNHAGSPCISMLT